MRDLGGGESIWSGEGIRNGEGIAVYEGIGVEGGIGGREGREAICVSCGLEETRTSAGMIRWSTRVSRMERNSGYVKGVGG